MLKELSIRNFAIIEDLQIDFSRGLTIMSGETGAGKSIIINAVQLLLGARAVNDMIRTGAEAAELEALFSLTHDSAALAALENCGIAYEDGLLIRRIISKSGNNKVYINGRLGTLQMLAEIVESLAAVASQHSHQALLSEDYQLDVLDNFGRLGSLRKEIAAAWNDFVPALRELALARKKDQQNHARKELLEFQKEELDSAAPLPNEDVELEQEQLRLQNSQEIYEKCSAAAYELYDVEGSLSERLSALAKSMEKAAGLDPKLAGFMEKLMQLSLESNDLAQDLARHAENIDNDAGRLGEIEERLDLLIKLKRKYGGSVDAALAFLQEVTAELDGFATLTEDISALEERARSGKKLLVDKALELSAAREKAARELAAAVTRELRYLKMEQAVFEVELTTKPAAHNNALSHEGRAMSILGFEGARFMIATNKGEGLKVLANIASGGELSRVILALKSVLSETETTGTIIFDEVDSGVGGGVAEVVGRKIRELSQKQQVICITHQAQIAKFADQHYSIRKQIKDGRTTTQIVVLADRDERVRELARMIGGEVLTEATLQHAAELIS